MPQRIIRIENISGDFADRLHSSQHHSDATDPIAPADIGAEPKGAAASAIAAHKAESPAHNWSVIAQKPIKDFSFRLNAESFFAIPINFQGMVYAAYRCRIFGGGHIGGRGYGGFNYEFWIYRMTSAYSTNLIQETYFGYAIAGIIQLAPIAQGIEVRIQNQSTTNRQDISCLLELIGTGSELKPAIF